MLVARSEPRASAQAPRFAFFIARVSAGTSLMLSLACSATQTGDGSTAQSTTASAISTTPDSSSTVEATAPSSATSAQSDTPSRPAELPINTTHEVQRLFEEPVSFFITGEDGRLGLLAIGENDGIVPYRYEKSKWEKLELSATQATPVSQFFGGIYFGRDNRPRLMGYRKTATGPQMVYLRFKDGAWRDQRKEIGSLAGDKSVLFGVLGEADPEVVCKAGSTCLLKSRKGWKEIAATITEDAVVRVFEGRGYAVTMGGFYRADESGFVALFGKPPWTTRPTGFWVSSKEDVVVIEPERSLIHEHESGATGWITRPSPVDGPRDVDQVGTVRFIVGDGGVVHFDGSQHSKLESPNSETPLGPLTRAIRVNTELFVAGRSGVWRIRTR